AVEGMRRIGYDGGNLGGRFGGQHLVGVEDEHPLVAERQVFERPVLLLGPDAVEVELDYVGAVVTCDPGGVIRAVGIHDKDFIGPRDRTETTGQINCLIACRDKEGNWNLDHSTP